MGIGPRACAVVSTLALAWMLLALPGAALAASPQPIPAATAAPVVGSGDSRSEGEGPGLVGSPLLIAAAVVALGAVAATGTLVVLRLRGPRPD